MAPSGEVATASVGFEFKIVRFNLLVSTIKIVSTEFWTDVEEEKGAGGRKVRRKGREVRQQEKKRSGGIAAAGELPSSLPCGAAAASYFAGTNAR